MCFRRLKWGLAAMVGAGLTFWQAGWFELTLVSEPTEQQAQAQKLTVSENIRLSAEISQQSLTTLPKMQKWEKADKAAVDARDLLQHALAGFEHLEMLRDVEGVQIVMGGMPDQQVPSPEVMVAYEAGKSLAEQNGLQYLIDQLNNTEGAAKLEVVAALWRYAAKIGVQEEALTALDLASYDIDAVVAHEAEKALADLRRFKRRTEVGPSTEELNPQPPVPAFSVVGDVEAGLEANINDPSYQAKYAEYAAVMRQREFDSVQALEENLHTARDDREHAEALHGLSLHRSEASVDAWLGLANDTNADVRYAAVQNLWRSAVKLDQNGRIASGLEAATWDQNKRVAELAKQAVTDLNAFQKRQEQAAAAPPVLIQGGTSTDSAAGASVMPMDDP